MLYLPKTGLNSSEFLRDSGRLNQMAALPVSYRGFLNEIVRVFFCKKPEVLPEITGMLPNTYN